MTQPIGWRRLPLNSFHLGIEHVAAIRGVRVPPTYCSAVRGAVVEAIRRIRYTHQRAKACFSVPGRLLNSGLVLLQQLISCNGLASELDSLSLGTGSRRRASPTFWRELRRQTLLICPLWRPYARKDPRSDSSHKRTWLSMYVMYTCCQKSSNLSCVTFCRLIWADCMCT